MVSRWIGLCVSILSLLAFRADGAPTPFAVETHQQAETCLAQAVSYEAGAEPEQGQEAVAQVVLNRLHDPSYPKTVCGVVFQGAERRTGCQFTFACDGSLARRRPVNWSNAVRIADAMLDGKLSADVGRATHYHAFYVQPGWAAQLTRVTRIGAHIFYAVRTGSSLPSPGVAEPSHGSPMPQPTSFSAWGLQTAVLLPGVNGIRIAAPPTPPPGPDKADRAFP